MTLPLVGPLLDNNNSYTYSYTFLYYVYIRVISLTTGKVVPVIIRRAIKRTNNWSLIIL